MKKISDSSEYVSDTNKTKNDELKSKKEQSSTSTATQNNLKGYILLQVEKRGEAWYVNDDGARFYMKDGKLYIFDEAEGDLIPYKRNKPTGIEIEPGLIEEGELLDTNSLDDDSFDEGFEINRG